MICRKDRKRIEMMRKGRLLVGVALAVMLLAAAGPARLTEKELLRNSPEFGDFHKAKEISGKDKASLKVWENYREFQGKEPSRYKELMLKGPGMLEVSYDDIWLAERDQDPTLVVPRERQGESLLIKFYWLEDQVQAFTVEKYCKIDPLTWEKLEKPGYRIIALLDRPALMPELAKLTAREEAFAGLSSAGHLQAAQRALAAGNPDEEDIKKRTYGRLDEARRHLEAVKRKSEEYGEAKKLLKEVERREKDLKKYKEGMRKALKEEMIKKREEMAKELDRDFLSKGFDVQMQLGGSEKNVLKMDCVLFSRPLVFVFVDKSDLLQKLRDAGFTEVVFANKKIKYAWEIDLDI